MKVLFAVVDGGGNIPPQLAAARALRSRGAEVHFVGHRRVREVVEAEGFSFEPFAFGREFDSTVPRSLPSIMACFARLSLDRRLGTCVVQAARRHRVDAVVVDAILIGAAAEITASGIPTVIFVHCFYRGMQDIASGPVGWLLRLRGIPPLGAEKTGALQIVGARADLDPVRGTPPIRHAGVIWQGRPAAAVPSPTPRILVSLSTCAFAGQRRMLQHILDAVEPLPVEATITVGPSIDARGLRVPANASMHSWLDHDQVLATASLVVGHGGHSTTMRALSFGVPLVIMPANPFIDQRGVGAAVEKAGAGMLLPKHAAAKRIRSAIETVLREPSYRESAGRIGAQIRQRDGAEVAADAIAEFVSGHSKFGARNSGVSETAR